MDKSPDAFRSIGEVARLVGVAPHVLRYWETQFTQISPVKRGDGRRYYRPEDVRLIAGLCQVLREEGLSIRGARRLIASDRGNTLRTLGATRLGELRAELAADAGAGGHSDQDAPPLPELIEPTAPSDWLGRLCAGAVLLHRAAASGAALPADLGALRDRLRQARG